MHKVDEMYEKYAHFKDYEIKVAGDDSVNKLIANYIIRAKSRGIHTSRMNACLIDSMQRYLKLRSPEVKAKFEESFFRARIENVTDEQIENYLEVCNLCSGW